MSAEPASEPQAGIRLAQIALVLGVVALVTMAGGILGALENFRSQREGFVQTIAGTASGVALECFVAGCLIRWSTGTLLTVTRWLVVAVSLFVAVAIAWGLVDSGGHAVDASAGFGLPRLAALALAAGGVVFGAQLVSWWVTPIDGADNEGDNDDVLDDAENDLDSDA